MTKYMTANEEVLATENKLLQAKIVEFRTILDKYANRENYRELIEIKAHANTRNRTDLIEEILYDISDNEICKKYDNHFDIITHKQGKIEGND